jgi:hypothetical protein
MKRIFLFSAVAVLFLLFAGCGTFSLGEINDPTATADPAARPARTAQAGAVIFSWDSVTDPVNQPRVTQTTQVAAPNAGFPDTFIRVRGADVTIADGAFVLGSSPGTGGGGRLIIGSNNPNVSNVDSEGTATHIPGQLDLSEGQFRLTINYKDATLGTSNYMLRVSINNNSQGMANSPLGMFSNLRTYNTREELISGSATANSNIGTTGDQASAGQIVITFNPSVRFSHPNAEGVRNLNSLTNAYLVLHTQNGGSLTVTGITLERM